MERSRRAIVRERANGRCEYCLMPQSLTSLPHTLDHIRARKHRGLTDVGLVEAFGGALETKRGEGRTKPIAQDAVGVLKDRS